MWSAVVSFRFTGSIPHFLTSEAAYLMRLCGAVLERHSNPTNSLGRAVEAGRYAALRYNCFNRSSLRWRRSMVVLSVTGI